MIPSLSIGPRTLLNDCNHFETANCWRSAIQYQAIGCVRILIVDRIVPNAVQLLYLQNLFSAITVLCLSCRAATLIWTYPGYALIAWRHCYLSSRL